MPKLWQKNRKTINRPNNRQNPNTTRKHKNTNISTYSEEEKENTKKELENFRKEGFVRVRVDGEIYDLSDEINIDKNKKTRNRTCSR